MNERRATGNKLFYIEFQKQDFVLVKHLCDIGVKCKMLSATNDKNRIRKYIEKKSEKWQKYVPQTMDDTNNSVYRE